MADFDITSLLANSAKTNADFNFGSLADAYYKGKEEQNKNALRDAFKDGVPTGPDGQPDFGAMSQKLFKLGDIERGTALSNLDIQRQRLKNSALWSKGVADLEGGDSGQPRSYGSSNDSDASNSLPPSLNRSVTQSTQPDLTLGGGGTFQNNGPAAPQNKNTSGSPTIMSVVAANNIPNDQIGAVSAKIGRDLKIDPLQPIDVSNPTIRNPLVAAIMQLKKMGVGDVFSQSEAAPAPQVVPPLPQQSQQSQVPLPPARPEIPPQVAPQQAAAVVPPPQVVPSQPVPPQVGSNAPLIPTQVPTQSYRQPLPNPQQDQRTFGPGSDLPTRGAVPTGMDPEIQRKIGFYSRMATDPNLDKDAHDFANKQLEALHKSATPTDTIKEYDLYRRQGGTSTFNDWQASKEGQKAAAGKLAEADINEQKEYIESGRVGSARLGTLNTIMNIVRSDPHADQLGWGAQSKVELGKALNSFGITNFDLSGPQAIQKLNAALAVEMAKSLTSRTTQFEFKTFLANNPGLELDKKGNERLIGIFSQLAKRDVDLGRLARDNRANWQNWDRVVKKYDDTHPVHDPVTGTRLSNDTVLSSMGTRPQIGDMVLGRRYLGGDTKNPKSWGPRQNGG